MISNVEGEEDKVEPYFMARFLNGNRFKAMIGFGSPVTIFALDLLKKIMKRYTRQGREMVSAKRYGVLTENR